MASPDEVLHDARMRLKHLRDVARDTMLAVARAEEILDELQSRHSQEAQPDANGTATSRLVERVRV